MFIWNGVPDLMIVCPGVLVFKSREHSAVLVFISIIYTDQEQLLSICPGMLLVSYFFCSVSGIWFKNALEFKVSERILQQCQFLVYTDHRYMLQ